MVRAYRTIDVSTESYGSRGIISYLYMTNQKDRIIVSTNSENKNTVYSLKYVIDGNPKTKYGSDYSGTYNQYIEIYIVGEPILIKGYSLQYGYPIGNACPPNNWQFAASVDGNEYIPLDIKNNNKILSDSIAHVFPLDAEKYGKYNYFRLYNTGTCNCPGYLYLNEIELFGTIT